MNLGLCTCDFPDSRAQQAAVITKHFLKEASFSFLRLGDGELRMLLDVQAGRSPRFHFRSEQDQMRLNLGDFDRLREAYEKCDFLDTYERFDFNRTAYPRLKFQPKPNQLRCSSPETSQIIFQWAATELKIVQGRKSVLIAGGEVPLLRELMSEPGFRDAARSVFPPEDKVHFLNLPDNGVGYWSKIEDIKNYIKREIFSIGAEVLFLSLSSAAKIICVDLAEEAGIVAVDFGAALRGLCGSATAGVSPALSSHFPYFYDVPLESYVRALRRAYPDMPKRDFIRKVNRQVILPLVPRRRGDSGPLRFLSPEQMCHSTEVLERFRDDLKIALRYHIKEAKSARAFALRDLAALLGHFRLNRFVLRDYGMTDAVMSRVSRISGFSV